MLKPTKIALFITGISCAAQIQAAGYVVEELPSGNAHKSIGIAINDQNDVAGMLLGKDNFPVRKDLLKIDENGESTDEFVEWIRHFERDSTLRSLGERRLTDAEKDRIINDFNSSNETLDSFSATYAVKYLSLSWRKNNYYFQKVGDQYGFVIKNANALKETSIEEDKNRSTKIQFNGLNQQGVAVGFHSAPYEFITNLDYDTTDGGNKLVNIWQQQYRRRALLADGDKVITLTPDETGTGGYSSFTDINNSGTVVGSMSTQLTEYAKKKTTNQDEKCVKFEPKGRLGCFHTSYGNRALFLTEAYQWTYQNGALVDAKPLGLAASEAEIAKISKDDNSNYFFSEPYAVNQSGVAVGVANTFVDGDVIRNHLALFRDGQVISVSDSTKWFNSTATDINDNGLMVGYAIKDVGDGVLRTKSFVYDAMTLNASHIGDDDVSFLPSFANRTNIYANAINNQKQIVGRAETTFQTPIPIRGYLYDMENKQLTNLDETTSCEQQSQYTIIDAVDINNDGVILANAIKLIDRKDDSGELILDANGKKTQVETTVSIRMTQSDAVKACGKRLRKDGVNSINDDNGSFGIFSILLFGLFRLMRRI